MSNFRIAFSHPWLLLLFIPALIFTFWPFFRIAKKFRRSRNRIISVTLHTLAMTLCILLLAGITFEYEVPNKENELLIVVDVSDSGSVREEQKNEYIQSIMQVCDGNYKVGIVSFGFDSVYAAPLTYDSGSVFSQYLAAQKPDTSATDIAAALKFASEQFTNPKTAKIVLLSDGIETDESALAEVKFLAAKGIKVDTVTFSAETANPEVRILDVKMPEESITVNRETWIDLTVQSNMPGEHVVTLKVVDKGFEGDAVMFLLSENIQTVKIPYVFESKGLHDMIFSISCEGDTLSQNNSFCSYVNIPVFEDILILENKPGEAASLADILESEFNVTVVNIYNDTQNVPKSEKELCEYEQVVLCNIANSDLVGEKKPQGMPENFDQMLYNYVYEFGGGMFTVGGENDIGADGNPIPHAYNRNDLAGTLLQQMLPVQAIDYTPPIAVMLVIDCSGSMSMGRMEAALQGAEECLNSLTERDFCGVTSFSTEASEAISVLPVTQKNKIREAIQALRDSDGGGTVFSSAIDKAGRALAPIPVERKHIILVTDGNPSDHLEQTSPADALSYGKYIDNNYNRNGITMSVITVGMSGDRNQMEESALRGHGNYYDVPLSAPDGLISTYMRQDLAAAAIEELKDGLEFTPEIRDYTSVFDGIDSTMTIPKLTGYYGTKAKDGVKIPLEYTYVPIYAQWQFGNGNVGSFLSDLSGNWSKQFLEDAVGQRLISNIAYSLAPAIELEPDKLDFVLKPKTENYISRLDVYTECGEGESISVSVKPLSQDAMNYYNSNVPVTARGDNVGFTYHITCGGLYQVLVEKKDAQGNTISDIAYYQTFAYSEEYNPFYEEGKGEELMAQIASDGNGIVPKDPVEVFASFVKAFRKSVDPRMVFLILAMIFVLLDIAVRKFKFKWPHEIIRDRKELKKQNAQKQ